MGEELNLYLMKYKIPINGQNIILYNLMLYGDRTVVHKENKKLIFFEKKEIINNALNYGQNMIRKYKNTFDEIEEHYLDISSALEIIMNKNSDSNATIINCYNTLDDILLCVSGYKRRKRLKMFDDFANHLTFNKSYKKYIDENKIEREELVDNIQFILKKIFSSGKILNIVNEKDFFYEMLPLLEKKTKK